MKRRICVCAALAAFSVAAVLPLCAQELIYAPGEKMGLENVPSPERNRWKARLCRPADYDGKELTECREADFFTLEYGNPLEPFALKLDENGKASRLWGERANEHAGQAIRLGRGWSGYVYAKTQMRTTIVQTGEGDIDWNLVFHSRTGKESLLSFKTKQGDNDVQTSCLFMVRLDRVLKDGGLELVAKGPAGATATVKDLRILPVRNWVYYRRRFTLDFDPWRAGASVAWKWGMSVKVNGREMLHTGLAGEPGVARIDLTGALVRGENEIVVAEDGNSGWETRPSLAAEVFAVSQSGETAFFPSDGKWEAKTGDRDWKKVRDYGAYGVGSMPNGTKYATGPIPLHAGPLAVSPHGTKWPVFDETKEIAWDIALPPKMDGVKVQASVRNALTGDAAIAAKGKDKIVFRGLKTGAYEIEWTLLRGDEVVDSDRSEMIVTGRLNLDEFAADDVETALRKRMRLVDEIDCTAEPEDRAFLDHSGYFSKHVTNVGRVIERDGFKVRETGPGWIDMIAWQIKCGTLGAPHIAEIDFPDTREQVIYASVTETIPVNFSNNTPPPGARGWANASGSVCSGGLFPTSGKMKTLRFTFFPGSRNITLNIENGCRGKPAGVCRVRIYEVDGSLPAMKIPQTERIYANHNERPLFFNWGCAVSPFMQEYDKSYREGMWAGAYKAIVNRVQFLKFAGHNAALEGAFMYYYLFKTRSGNSNSVDELFDPLVPVLMMYKANGIRAFVGYEYTGTPALMADDIRGTSDRDVAAGKNTLSFVDRYGRQSLLYGFGGNMNFLDPRTKASMESLMKEIYDRYEPLGVEGVVVQTEGCAWQPHFGGIAIRQDKDEIGYDDLTVSMFEREKGIALGVDAKDPKRFAKRYDAIHATPERLAKWKEWRFDKLADVHKALAETVRTRSRWRYAFSPPPFPGAGDGMSAEFGGYTPSRYPRDGGIELWPKACFGSEWNIAGYAKAFAPHRSATTRAFDAAYLTPGGLNEHNWNKVDAAKRWLWRSYGVIVYDLKPAGEYAFFDCVTACRDYTPKSLLRTWLDVNLTTGHDAEARRFLNGFYSTPLGEPKPYPQAKGVTAHIYGKKLQLMNLTPYEIVEKDGKMRIPPFGIVVLDEPRPVKFVFTADGAAACAKVAKAMSDSRVLELLSDAKRTAWAGAKDDYERMVLSRDAEILDILIKLEASPSSFANQSKLEAALAKDGVARINCGYCAGEWKDELGATWLPDQDDIGFRAYGCVNASRTSRGEIAIHKTDRPSIYRTEASTSAKPLVYRIPVPEGTYRVRVHMADTFFKEDRGAIWKFGIGKDWRNFNIWKVAGGKGCTAVVTTFENVKPVDGAIKIEFPIALVNGIEIERLK